MRAIILDAAFVEELIEMEAELNNSPDDFETWDHSKAYSVGLMDGRDFLARV